MGLSVEEQTWLNRIKNLQKKEANGENVDLQKYQELKQFVNGSAEINMVQNRKIPTHLKAKERLKRASKISGITIDEIDSLFVENQDESLRYSEDEILIQNLKKFFARK